MKRIGILGNPYPENRAHSNRFYIGRALTKKFKVDIVGYKEGNHPELLKYFDFKEYTSVKVTNYLTRALRSWLNTWRYCRKEAPDVLMTIQAPHIEGVIITVIGKWFFKKKVVVRYSASVFKIWRHKVNPLNKFISWLSQFWTRIIFQADRIITPDPEERKELIEHGCKKEKVISIPQITDQDKFRPPKSKAAAKRKLGFKPDDKIIIYVSTQITKYKGAESVLNIVPELFKKEPKAFLCIIGQDVHGYAKKIKNIAPKRVRLITKLPPEELIKYYEAAEIFIQPVLESGNSRVILEAAACGLYVIARDNGSVKLFSDKVFTTDKEFLKYLLDKKASSSLKSKLPKTYTQKYLENEYVKLVESMF